jgi:hypothetical protein
MLPDPMSPAAECLLKYWSRQPFGMTLIQRRHFAVGDIGTGDILSRNIENSDIWSLDIQSANIWSGDILP